MYIYIYIYTLKLLIDTHFKLLNIINRSHKPSIHFIPIYSLLLHSFRFSSSNTTLLPYYPCLKAVLHFCKGKRKQKLQKLQRNKKEKWTKIAVLLHCKQNRVKQVLLLLLLLLKQKKSHVVVQTVNVGRCALVPLVIPPNFNCCPNYIKNT